MDYSSEKELLTLLKTDAPSALKVLFDLYHNSLCLLAYRFMKDRDVSKDIVQDVFLKFWNNRKTIEITFSLAAYLKRSVINACLNHLEKEQRNNKVQLTQISKHPLGNATDQAYAFDELSAQLDLAIARLPVRTRAVFILIRKEEMSYKEAADSLDISTKAVEKEMMRALKLLREMLKNFLPAILFGSIFI